MSKVNAHNDNTARQMKVDDQTFQVLELERILDFYADFAWSSLGADSIRNRRPVVGASTEEFDAAVTPLRELWLLYSKQDDLPLNGLFDPRPHLKLIQPDNTYLEPLQYLELAKFSELTGRLIAFLDKKSDLLPSLAEQCGQLTQTTFLHKKVRALIDDEGLVRDNASLVLKKLRDTIRQQTQQLLRTVQRMVRTHWENETLTDNFYTVRNGRYCLPVASGRKNKIKGIVHGSSHTGETFYIEPHEVTEMTNNLIAAQEAEKTEVRRLLIELADELRPELPTLKVNVQVIAEVDDLAARARAGWQHGLHLPQIFGDRSRKHALYLKEVHHPLLAFKLASAEKSIPINVEFSNDDRILIISGPNAGGKTTSLKTLGVTVWLAQAGFPLPIREDSELVAYEHLGVLIGDLQDILSGDSTFSAHLKRLHHLAQESDDRSLLIFDEIAAGTDPSEGAPLAMAFLESLAQQNVTVFCSSHLGPLKEWANTFDTARNASFQLDPNTQQPNYELRMNLPGSSEALSAARRLGFPEGVLERARELIPKERQQANELLNEVHEKLYHVTQQQEAQDARWRVLEERETAAREMLTDLKAERRSYRERLLNETLQEIDAIKREVERQVAALPPREGLALARENLDDLKRDKKQAAKKEEIEELQAEEQASEKNKNATPDTLELKIGQTIYIKPLEQEGEVVLIERERGLIRLRVGGAEIEMKLAQLNEKAMPRGGKILDLPDYKLKLDKKPGDAEQKTLDQNDRSANRDQSENPDNGSIDAVSLMKEAVQRREGHGMFRNSPHADTAKQAADGAETSAKKQKSKNAKSGKGKKKKKFTDADFLKTTITRTPEKTAAKTTTRPVSQNVSKADAKKGQQGFVTVTRSKQSSITMMTLDLHGLRVEEALEKVEDHLNAALLHNYPFVRLMHGVGTGALRRGIHDYLRTHPAVTHYTLAPRQEGGEGVTVVEFR
jgi:DNA mismatch repair protein MutS2